MEASTTRGFDVNRAPSLSVAGAAAAEEDEEHDEAGAAAAASSSPNNSAGSFPTDFSAQGGQVAPGGGGDRGACSRASDDDDGGSARKKLRLSKEQSAFLEESFKEHATLNPVSNRWSRRNHQVLAVPRPFSILTFVVAGPSMARRSRSWRWRSSSTSGRARWRCGSRTAEPGACVRARTLCIRDLSCFD